MKLISKHPADRPQTAGEVLLVLKHLDPQHSSHAQPRTSETAAVPPPHQQEQTTLPNLSLTTLYKTFKERTWIPLFIVLLLVLFIGAPSTYFYGSDAVRIVLNQGRIVIDTDQHVEIIVLAGREKVHRVETKSTHTITVIAGKKYRITIQELPDGIRTETDEFSLTRNGKQVVNVPQEFAKGTAGERCASTACETAAEQ